jgi:hypothetical protein
MMSADLPYVSNAPSGVQSHLHILLNGDPLTGFSAAGPLRFRRGSEQRR